MRACVHQAHIRKHACIKRAHAAAHSTSGKKGSQGRALLRIMHAAGRTSIGLMKCGEDIVSLLADSQPGGRWQKVGVGLCVTARGVCVRA